METDSELRAQYGTHRPFSVPEGYFDTLGQRVARSIEAETAQANTVKAVRKSLWQRLSPLLAAASIAGVVALVGLAAYQSDNAPTANTAMANTAMANANSAEANGEYTDELDRMADYTMIDKDDVYAYIFSE